MMGKAGLEEQRKNDFGMIDTLHQTWNPVQTMLICLVQKQSFRVIEDGDQGRKKSLP